MQVKTCPKCGFENKPTNASCSKCYSALEDVPLTESTRKDDPVLPTVTVARPPRPASPSAPPPPGPSQTQQMPPPPQNVTTVTAPPPAYGYPGAPQSQSDQIKITIGPPHRKPYVAIIIPVVILGCILGAVVLREQMKPPKPKVPPDKVVLNFLAAKKSGQFVRVRPYLSADSIYQLEHFMASKQARSAGIDQKEVANMLLFGQHPTPADIAACTVITQVVEDEDLDENMAAVHVSLEPAGESEGASPRPDGTVPKPEASFSFVFASESEFVLVQEGSEWKVDLPLSTKRQAKLGLQNLLGGKLPGMK